MDDKVRSDRAPRVNPTDWVPAWVPRGTAPTKAEPVSKGTALVGAYVDGVKPPAPLVSRSDREVLRLSREVSSLGATLRDAMLLLSKALVSRSEPIINVSPVVQPTPIEVRNEFTLPEAKPPEVHFHAPEAPAPVVNFSPVMPEPAPVSPTPVTIINQVQPAAVTPAPVHVFNEVNMPEQAPPVVNVPATPVTVRVEAMEEFTTTEVTDRDAAGRLLRTQTHRRREFDTQVESEEPEV